MKSIIVPANAITKTETMVIQLTLKEAEQLLEVYDWSIHYRGFKPEGYHYIKTFVESFKTVVVKKENEKFKTEQFGITRTYVCTNCNTEKEVLCNHDNLPEIFERCSEDCMWNNGTGPLLYDNEGKPTSFRKCKMVLKR